MSALSIHDRQPNRKLGASRRLEVNWGVDVLSKLTKKKKKKDDSVLFQRLYKIIMDDEDRSEPV